MKHKRGNGKLGDLWQKFKDKISVERRFSKSTAALLQKHGDAEITSATIFRKPIESYIVKALNAISGDAFDRAIKKMNYDSMFHLGMVLETEDGSFLIEKNAQVVVEKGSVPSGAETVTVPLKGTITLGELLAKTEQHMGSKRFHTYRGFNSSDGSNCQGFIDALLTANGLNSAEAKRFVMQDARAVIKKMPFYTEWVANKVTDGVAKLEQMMGEGRKRKRCKKCGGYK